MLTRIDASRCCSNRVWICSSSCAMAASVAVGGDLAGDGGD